MLLVQRIAESGCRAHRPVNVRVHPLEEQRQQRFERVFASVPLRCPRIKPRAQLLRDHRGGERAQVMHQPTALLQEVVGIVRLVFDHLHDECNVHALVEGGVQVRPERCEPFELVREFVQQRFQLLGVALLQASFEIVPERLMNGRFNRATCHGLSNIIACTCAYLSPLL